MNRQDLVSGPPKMQEPKMVQETPSSVILSFVSESSPWALPHMEF